MKNKVSLPQGTRDFGPEVVRKRGYILNTIKEVFELYGFQPLETPAMENMETLMGKYGEEGDKLIFKILNNGLADPKNQQKASIAFENLMEGKNDKNLTERALRYDLTIPFARYVAMNHGQLTLPFKRYQVQPVWRADRPQKGRYREFYQCDADVVGSTSLISEVELAAIYRQVFNQLGIPVEIRINSRKVLAALADACGGSDKLTDITVAIDKLDKIGPDKVREELLSRGLSASQVAIVSQYLEISGSNSEKLEKLKALVGMLPAGTQGIGELETVLRLFNQLVLSGAGGSATGAEDPVTHAGSSVRNAEKPEAHTRNSIPVSAQPTDQPGDCASLLIDLTLARGLNYYTGIIFEVKARNVQMGSIGGGGRYDDLTGLFGVPGIPGVGISFGVDRIYDVMEELDLFPAGVHTGTQVLFFNLGEAESMMAFSLMQQLRARGIRCELYHEPGKFDKQFKYADKKGIPYAVMIGSKELESGHCTVKNLGTGNQETILMNALSRYSFGS